MWLLVAAALADNTTYTYAPYVVHPAPGGTLPRDGIVVVESVRFGVTVGLYDRTGQPIPANVYEWGEHHVLQPLAPLEPGEVEVQAESYYGLIQALVVEDRLAGVVGPPVPVSRMRDTCLSLLRIVSYASCGSPIQVLATSDTEPPPPTLADPGATKLGEWLPAQLEDSPPGVAWIGSLDEAGRFGGWTRDEVPAVPGRIIVEQVEWASDECPPPGQPWVVVSDEPCDPATGDTADTAETGDTDGTGATDTDVDGGPPLDDGSGGCGCASARPATGAWVLALAALLRRRRTPR